MTHPTAQNAHSTKEVQKPWPEPCLSQRHQSASWLWPLWEAPAEMQLACWLRTDKASFKSNEQSGKDYPSEEACLGWKWKVPEPLNHFLAPVTFWELCWEERDVSYLTCMATGWSLAKEERDFDLKTKADPEKMYYAGFLDHHTPCFWAVSAFL